MTGKLTHIAENGSAHMVDIADKAVTRREATARGRITMSKEAVAALRTDDTRKGDVLGTARIAGIMAAKRTHDLIPLCHPLPLSQLRIDLTIVDDGVEAETTAVTDSKTGVEMEALTASSIALLTIYDMLKAVDRTMCIGEVRVVAKSGGRSGDWQRE